MGSFSHLGAARRVLHRSHRVSSFEVLVQGQTLVSAPWPKSCTASAMVWPCPTSSNAIGCGWPPTMKACWTHDWWSFQISTEFSWILDDFGTSYPWVLLKVFGFSLPGFSLVDALMRITGRHAFARALAVALSLLGPFTVGHCWGEYHVAHHDRKYGRCVAWCGRWMVRFKWHHNFMASIKFHRWLGNC